MQKSRINKRDTTIYGKTKVLRFLLCYLYLNDATSHKSVSILSRRRQNMIYPDESVVLNSERAATL